VEELLTELLRQTLLTSIQVLRGILHLQRRNSIYSHILLCWGGASSDAPCSSAPLVLSVPERVQDMQLSTGTAASTYITDLPPGAFPQVSSLFVGLLLQVASFQTQYPCFVSHQNSRPRCVQLAGALDVSLASARRAPMSRSINSRIMRHNLLWIELRQLLRCAHLYFGISLNIRPPDFIPGSRREFLFLRLQERDNRLTVRRGNVSELPSIYSVKRKNTTGTHATNLVVIPLGCSRFQFTKEHASSWNKEQ
jgi:hypothetical protein